MLMCFKDSLNIQYFKHIYYILYTVNILHYTRKNIDEYHLCSEFISQFLTKVSELSRQHWSLCSGFGPELATIQTKTSVC